MMLNFNWLEKCHSAAGSRRASSLFQLNHRAEALLALRKAKTSEATQTLRAGTLQLSTRPWPGHISTLS